MYTCVNELIHELYSSLFHCFGHIIQTNKILCIFYSITVVQLSVAGNLGPDLQNILRQSYDYLKIMSKLRSTYDGRLIYQPSYEERNAFLGTITRNIIRSCEVYS